MQAGERSASTPAIDLPLPRSVQAPGIARSATRELCERLELSGGRCQTLLVLVSEIVTNAVRHSDGPHDADIAFHAALEGSGAVRVEVNDGGSGFRPVPRDPAKPEGGWGLFLVDRESSAWGVDSRRGTSVWFVFALDTCEDE
jgi:anti-sigma regulatory factor (Ser/Thr protein kinase)